MEEEINFENLEQKPSVKWIFNPCWHAPRGWWIIHFCPFFSGLSPSTTLSLLFFLLHSFLSSSQAPSSSAQAPVYFTHFPVFTWTPWHALSFLWLLEPLLHASCCLARLACQCHLVTMPLELLLWLFMHKKMLGTCWRQVFSDSLCPF